MAPKGTTSTAAGVAGVPPTDANAAAEPPSKFISRVAQLSVIDSALQSATSSYAKVKDHTPSLMRPAIDSAELTTRQAVENVIAMLQRLPLPLKLADDVACAGLDRLERFAEYRIQLVERLRAMTPETLRNVPLTDEEKNFYNDVVALVSGLSAMAVSEVRSNFNLFVEGQLTLLDTLADGLDKLYGYQRNDLEWLRKGLERLKNPALQDDTDGKIQKIRDVVAEATKQCDKFAAALKLKSCPFASLWTHLQRMAGNLKADTLNSSLLQSLSSKVKLLREVLAAVVDPLRRASEDPNRWRALSTSVYELMLHTAQQWLPRFATQRLPGAPVAPATAPATASATASAEVQVDLREREAVAEEKPGSAQTPRRVSICEEESVLMESSLDERSQSLNLDANESLQVSTIISEEETWEESRSTLADSDEDEESEGASLD